MASLSPASDQVELETDERDYSERLGDVLGDSDDEESDASDSEGGFVYDGEDAEASGPYREQLSEILEQPIDELDELEDKHHVQTLLLRDAPSPPQSEELNDNIEPETVKTESMPPTPLSGIPFRRSGFLHPNISRLRSVTPQTPSTTSTPSVTGHRGGPETPSHLSTLSRSSSKSELTGNGLSGSDTRRHEERVREPFRWASLKNLIVQIKSTATMPQKAARLLGEKEAPTVMAVNGIIAIGTSQGRAYVFDFKQSLRAICQVKTNSPVTAIALSQDHTFVGIGHLSGEIHLFDLADSSKPARSVPTTARAEVVAGRREGHLHQSRITQLGFVGARHTAIVSADEYGLAFYHSLGKVLFVEATDVLRILGKYPEEIITEPPAPKRSGNDSPPSTIRGSSGTRRRFRQSPNIMAMEPLPLGTIPHPTDSYNVVAIITPVKLVIVALKPSAKTWYRKRRRADLFSSDTNDHNLSSVACIAWFPSVTVKSEDPDIKTSRTTLPTLAYTWGSTARLLTVEQTLPAHLAKAQKPGVPHEQGQLVFTETRSWQTSGDIEAIRWLSHYQILLVLSTGIELWDVLEGCKLVERATFSIGKLVPNTIKIDGKNTHQYSQSVCVNKGKLFMLGPNEVIIGALLLWTDHLLHLVDIGDTISAIELATAYFNGTAAGNRSGLPHSVKERQRVTGSRLRELMQASVQHAFSPDRLTDETHRTADNRGIDLTYLFEGLIPACVHACKALDELDYVYDDLFEAYSNTGIGRMFLNGIEPFLLEGTLGITPPWITQQLIAMHEENGNLKKAEALIWHLDPLSLDTNQAIRLCRQYDLWDALIYVYTRGMKDYISPIVELVPLVRTAVRLRKDMALSGPGSAAESAMEEIAPNAYKVFPFLAATLSGLAYPSQAALPKEESAAAKADVYSFLIDGRSRVWPPGSGGKLILTAEEEGGAEPTYPYLRLLLKFDAESLLHTLDIAFEDSYLNDDNKGVGRLIIIKILLEMLGTGSFTTSDDTLIRIFVARNVPKYPQFIKMPPSLLHSVLVGLASDPDRETTEDRQLAAEYLLSTYKPREGDTLWSLFEDAGFYRILRSWYKAEKQWSSLLEAYLEDPAVSTADLFPAVENVLTASSKRGIIMEDVVLVAVDSLPRLLEADLAATALLLDRRMPEQHSRVVEMLEDDSDRQLIYLRTLLLPDKSNADQSTQPSNNIDSAGKLLFFDLLAQVDPNGVVDALEAIQDPNLPSSELVPIFKEHLVYDAVIVMLQRDGDIKEAFEYVEVVCQVEAAKIVQLLDEGSSLDERDGISLNLERIKRMIKTVQKLCQRASDQSLPADSRWLQLLRAQILLVQAVVDGNHESEAASSAIEALRILVQESLDSLLLHSAAQGISFPNLFKTLVTSTSEANKYSSRPSKELYAEFRTILTGMLNTYRYDGELLSTTNALVSRDVFATFQEWARKRDYGWKPTRPICKNCNRSLLTTSTSGANLTDEGHAIRVEASGLMYHVSCPA